MKEMKEMKEIYVTPEVEIITFDAEDVITTSDHDHTPAVPFNLGEWN